MVEFPTSAVIKRNFIDPKTNKKLKLHLIHVAELSVRANADKAILPYWHRGA